MKKKPSLNEAVNRYMQGLGATPDARWQNEWTIETIFGTLRVHAQDTWIHLRFMDVARVKGLPIAAGEISRHSGKWNIHFFAGSKPDTGACLEELKRRVEAVTSGKPAAPQ